MPYINKKTVKPKQVPYRHEQASAPFYNSVHWKRLRNYYIKAHPLCEECLKHGIVKPAEQVHHKTEFLRGRDDNERWNLLLDEDNLMSLCVKCHNAKHSKHGTKNNSGYK